MSRREQALSPGKEWEVEGGGGSLFWEGGEKGRSEGRFNFARGRKRGGLFLCDGGSCFIHGETTAGGDADCRLAAGLVFSRLSSLVAPQHENDPYTAVHF